MPAWQRVWLRKWFFDAYYAKNGIVHIVFAFGSSLQSHAVS
jgi:hypothetical protein